MRLWTLTLSAVALCMSAGWPGIDVAAAAGNFDGAWNVTLTCPRSGEGEGYTWQFKAQVAGGRFAGKYVNPADPQNYGVLTGTIGAGGDAVLTMSGSTGVPAYNVHHEGLHTKIHYTTSAHFDGSSGTGKRVEQRPCDLSFAKN